MVNEIITTLHPDQDPDTNLYPNIKRDNIPNGSVNASKLDPSVLSMIGSLKPSGVNTSTNILSKTSNDGIWVGSDTGKWYYWDGSQYVEGGDYISNIDNVVLHSGNQLQDNNGNDFYPNVDKTEIQLNEKEITLTFTTGKKIIANGMYIDDTSNYFQTAIIDVNKDYDNYIKINNPYINANNGTIAFYRGTDYQHPLAYYVNQNINFFVIPDGADRCIIQKVSTLDLNGVYVLYNFNFIKTFNKNYKDFKSNFDNLKLSELGYGCLYWLSAYITNTQSTIISHPTSRTYYFKCKPNTTYVINKTLGHKFCIGETYEKPIISGNVYNISGSVDDTTITTRTITTSNNAKYIVIFAYNSNADVGISVDDIVNSINIVFPITNSTYNKNILEGKTIVGLGDSLMYGNNLGVSYTWLNKLGVKNKMVYYNYGVNGNPIAVNPNQQSGQDPMCIRYVDMIDNADYIIIEGGANDWALNTPIGNNNDNVNTTFKGALNILIDGLIQKYPKGKILFMTNYRRYMGYNSGNVLEVEYVNAMIEICKIKGVRVFNNYDDIGLSFTNQYQKTWIDEGISQGGTQTTHFSDEAYTWMLPIYENVIKGL